MIFTKHDDGTITVDEWDVETLISQELLENAWSEVISRDEDVISIKVSNGWAEYRIVGTTFLGQLEVQLIEAKRWEPGTPKYERPGWYRDWEYLT